MHKKAVNPFIEARLVRAYLNLFLVSQGEHGTKMSSLARFGGYEVRLFEFPDHADETLPLWIELFAHDTQATLDSFGCDDFEAAVAVADEFTTRAKRLHERRSEPKRVDNAQGDADGPTARHPRELPDEILALLRKPGSPRI